MIISWTNIKQKRTEYGCREQTAIFKSLVWSGSLRRWYLSKDQWRVTPRESGHCHGATATTMARQHLHHQLLCSYYDYDSFLHSLLHFILWGTCSFLLVLFVKIIKWQMFKYPVHYHSLMSSRDWLSLPGGLTLKLSHLILYHGDSRCGSLQLDVSGHEAVRCQIQLRDTKI